MPHFHEIRIHGRGGQGVQTVGHLIAQAYFSLGLHVQTFATYGGERRGAPVTAFVRVCDAPIARRCDIERPQTVLLFEPTFLADGSGLQGLDAGAAVLLNTARLASDFPPDRRYRLICLDALRIARAHGLGRIINTAMLGAYCRVHPDLPLQRMADTITAHVPQRTEANLAAMRDAYAQTILGEEVAAHV